MVFLTDEDDCSVQLARRAENNPMTRDCSTPDQEAGYDCFNLDYRCLARSVMCDQAMNTAGTKTNCKERTSNYLDPVSRFVTFFKGAAPRRQAAGERHLGPARHRRRRPSWWSVAAVVARPPRF